MKKLITLIAVPVLVFFGFAAPVVTTSTGCTKQQQDTVKTIITDTSTVLTDIQKACVFAQVILGTVEPAAVPALMVACHIDAAADKALDAVLAEMSIAKMGVAQAKQISLEKPGTKPAICQ